jgi:hypothetical protein
MYQDGIFQFFDKKIGFMDIFVDCSINSPVFLLMILKQYQIALLFGIISAIGLIYTVKILPFCRNGVIYWTNLKSIPIGKTSSFARSGAVVQLQYRQFF